MSEITFQKYKTSGSGYHWDQISKSLRKRNAYVVARYQMVLDSIGTEIKNQKVLDMGCGDGVLPFLLAERGANATGVDLSTEAIAFARQKCKNRDDIQFTVASVYKTPFENRSFDSVVSSEVIEHLEHPENILAEIRRVWNKKGKVVITTPIKFTEKPLDPMHYQEFFEKDFEALINQYFPDHKIDYIKSHPLFWMEFQNKATLGHSITRKLLNLIDITFGLNPHRLTKGWRYYTLQMAVIHKGKNR